MIKKQLPLLLSLCLTLGTLPVLAAPQEDAKEETSYPSVMTLDDATKYAIEHSLTLQACKADIRQKEYAVKEINITKSSLNKYNQLSSFDQYLISSGYMTDTTQMQVRMAERTLASEEDKLKIQVKNDFYTYLSNQEKTKVAQTNLESAKIRLEQTQAKLNKGTASQLEVENFKVAHFSAENALKQAKRTEEQSLLTLKSTMTYPTGEPLKVSGTFQRQKIDVLPPDEAIEAAKKHVNYLNLTEGFENAKARYQAATKWYAPVQIGYSTETYTYQAAEATYHKNVDTLFLNIRNVYNNLLTVDENLQLLIQNQALLEKNLEASRLQYELGMITATDLIEQEQKLFDTQNQMIDLQLNEWILRLNYKALYSYDTSAETNPDVKTAK